MKRRLLSLLLCAAMLFSLAACAGDTPEPAPSPEPTPAPDPVELALEDYGACAEAYSAADDSTFLIESSTVRSVGDVGYEEKVTETLVYQDMQGESPLILRDRKQVYYGRNSYSEYLYADGCAYINGLYKSEISLEDFQADIYPVALITPELYEDISIKGSELVLSSPTAGEPWLGEGIDFIDAEARIVFKGSVPGSDEIESMVYEAEYMSNHVKVELELSLSPQENEADKDLRDEIPLSAELKLIPDMYIPELFNKASVAVQNSDHVAITRSDVINVEYIDLTYMTNSEVFINGSGSDICMQQDHIISFIQGQEAQSYVISESFRDGLYRYTENGEYFEQPLSYEVVSAEDYTFYELAAIRNLSDFKISELDGYILIDFNIDPSLGNGVQQGICRALFDRVTYLDERSSSFETISYSGYLAFDADTMLPCAYANEFVGAHSFPNGKQEISTVDVIAYDLLSSLSGEMAAGIDPEEREPETPATPLFYKVSGSEGQTMWLLGTIHVGDERTAFLPESIYKALDRSHALALEVDPESVDAYLANNPELLEAMQEKMYYPSETDISRNIDPQLYEEARKYLKAVGAYGYQADRCTPTVWASAIENAFMLHVGQLSSLYGVEERLMDIARNKSIEIRSVEDVGEHSMVLYNFSEGLQELLLYETISYGRSEYAAELKELYELWCAGDETALRELLAVSSDIEFSEEEQELLSPEEMEAIEGYVAEYNKALSTDRDAQMVEKAIEYLESGETVFFAVGLAHVLAENGLVDGLRAAGYTVELVS